MDSDVIGITGLVLLFLVGFFVIAFMVITPFMYVTCSSFGKQTERPVKFSVLSGCFAQNTHGDWINTDNYYNTAVEK